MTNFITMYLKQKIQVNGVCEKMYLTADCTKIIYVDKNTSDVWAVELNKGYAIKSLNHYNNSFLDEFLGLVKYVYYIDKNYMKDNYLTIDANLVGMEIDFFEDKIDKDFLAKYINDDPSYSYDWLKNKKVILGLI